jgi:hypothetical protein
MKADLEKSGLDFIRSTPPGDFIIMWRVFPFHSRLTDIHASPNERGALLCWGCTRIKKKNE